MSVATFDDLVALPRLRYAFWKQTASAENPDTWALLGNIPTTATTPGTVYDDVSDVAIVPTLGGGGEMFLTEWDYLCDSNAAPGALWLVDRLVGVSQAITSTGDKTINSSALDRYTSGEDVMCFLEISTLTATNVPVISLSEYTNQDGTGSRAGAAVTFPTNNVNVGNWIGPMPLQAGDSGIRSIQKINVATAPTAGVINVVLAKPLHLTGVGVKATPDRVATLMEYLFPKQIHNHASLTLLSVGYAGTESMEGGLEIAVNA
jgi:hypothetical protein